MSSIYTNAGDEKKTHIHRLIMLYRGIPNQFGDRYRCYTCNAGLKNRSGVVIGTEVIHQGQVRVIKAGHILKIDSLHDAQAHCSCGNWEFMRTGSATEAEIVENFHTHAHLPKWKASPRRGIVSDRSQVQMIGAAPLKTWQEYREGSLATYGGGYRSDDDLKAFHHGIETVFNLLEAEFPKAALCKAAPAMATLLRTLAAQSRQAMTLSGVLDGVLLTAVQEAEQLLKDLEG